MSWYLNLKINKPVIMQKTDEELKKKEKLFSIALYGLFAIVSVCVLLIILALIL